MDATITSVVRLWEQQCSQREISRRLGISEQKVKKVLITAGCLKTRESILAQQGKTVAEIMEITGKGYTAVVSNLPYVKGIYNAEYPTINAIRIKKCRERNG